MRYYIMDTSIKICCATRILRWAVLESRLKRDGFVRTKELVRLDFFQLEEPWRIQIGSDQGTSRKQKLDI